jgi:hypothetical protein
MNKPTAIALTVTCALLVALPNHHRDAHIAAQPSTYIQASPAVAANSAARAVVATKP